MHALNMFFQRALALRNPGIFTRTVFRAFYSEGSDLVLSVIQARDLTATEHGDSSPDTFVKIWLSPSRHPKQQTATVRETSSPIFKERFSFTIDAHEIAGKTVHMEVIEKKYGKQKTYS